MDAYEHRRNFFGSASVDVDVAAGDGSKDNIIVVKGALYTIFVQRIAISVVVDAAQSLIFQDDGVPLIIAKTKASPGLGPLGPIDFGPEGTPLAQGKNLDIATSAAGIGARVHVEAYQKLTGVGAA